MLLGLECPTKRERSVQRLSLSNGYDPKYSTQVNSERSDHPQHGAEKTMDIDQSDFHPTTDGTGAVMMELAVAPPPRVAAGLSLQTPLVVTFSGLPPTIGEDRRENGQTFTLPELSAIWVFLSLTTANMEENSTTRREDLFCGKRADSLHQLGSEPCDDRPTIAYAAFPDLVITQPVSYRIKVNIIDMDAYVSANVHCAVKVLTFVRAFRSDIAEDAARVVRCLHSSVFEVVEAGEHSGCGEFWWSFGRTQPNTQQNKSSKRR